VWAHAEYIKLLRSIADGRIFDLPPQTAARYKDDRNSTPHALWRLALQCRYIECGKVLRVELFAPATVVWSADGWATTEETLTRDTTLGVHVADLALSQLPPGTRVELTLHWEGEKGWEGQNFSVDVRAPGED